MRAAIVGLNWGIRTHLRVLREQGWSIEALIGRDEEHSRVAARNLQVPLALTRIADLRSIGLDLDLVVVAVPWPYHKAVLDDALRADYPVLLEHPLSYLMEESRSLAASISHRKTPIFVNFASRYFDVVTELRAVLDSLAEAEAGPATVTHRMAYPSDEETEWLPLLSSHCLDTAHHLFGALDLESAQLEGVERVNHLACPGWAWPLVVESGGAQQRSGRRATAGRWHARIRCGSYRLWVGRDNVDDFVETMDVVLGDRRFAYELRLTRVDESSPWRSTGLWRSDAHEMTDLPLPSAVQGDAWLAAHAKQVRAIGARLRDQCISVPPATASDALAVQDLIQRAADTTALEARRPS